MAPSRRKGTSKAAAAAAACRQWKVGDLVLAKVKGFPAWPATVSEPEKWGYSRDRKKVLVYFFGTQQIAFCNPVDIEAFTEDKKQSLFVKRRGKGADFVRAVHEIIDCFEKLKSEQPVNGISTDEVAVRSADVVVELAKTHLEGEALNTLESSAKKNPGDESEPDFGNGAGTVAAKHDVSHDGEMLSADPTSVEVMDEPGTKTYSTRKNGGSRNGAMERRAPSVRRLRSSLRTDPEVLHNRLLSSDPQSMSAGYGANTVRGRSARRNKMDGKQSDGLDRNNLEQPAFVSNGSTEESDSEIASVDSGSFSLNEGSSVESGCKPGYRCAVQCESEVELSHRLELQSSAVILKKKRKPNRKRLHTDLTESSAGLDKDTALEMQTARTAAVLLGDLVKSDEKNSKELKEDGDEHLPLVKRARVRMGRSAPEGELLDNNEVLNDAKSPGASDKSLEQGHEGDGSCLQNSICIKSDSYDSSPSKKCSSTRPPFWEIRKQFGGSLDGESALPPSKRLHRALEAMSAYAADDDKQDVDGLCRAKTSMNGYCSRAKEVCCKLSGGIESENNSNGDRMGSPASAVPEDTTIVASAKVLVAQEGLEHLSEVPALSAPLACDDSLAKVSCEDKCDVSGAVIQTRQKEGLSNDCPSSTSVAHSANPKFDGELQGPFKCELPSPGPFMTSDENCENEAAESAKRFEDPISEVSGRSADYGSNDEVIMRSPDKGGIMGLGCAEAECGKNNKLCQVSLDVSIQDNEESINMKKAGSASKNISATSSSSFGKVVDVSLKELHMSGLSSASDDQFGDKAVSTTLSSSSLTDGMDSFARATTPNTLTCNMSTVDRRYANVGSFSPLPHQLLDKPRTSGKLSSRAEANVALDSFEATLGILSRTKESIGRATRVALDCAKFGVASKVVEIIAEKLENESNLHRRVDLFFLVDSIAQFSKGLKGHISGIYPSTIQGVLPRLISAAAPPGSVSQENRRQCLKVLRVWQERKILPESAIRPYIRGLESFCISSLSRAFSRRPMRTQRPFDDPIREMEGMQVDEYGSNSSFQLPGFRMPAMLKDEEVSDSDGESFEAVTPEHPAGEPNGEEAILANEKHKHILEDVDGELEMEDVSPLCEGEIASISYTVRKDPAQISRPDDGNSFGAPFHPPLPKDDPPSSPPLPTSLPPPPPPPPPPPSLPSVTLAPSIVQSKISMVSQNIKDNLQETVFQHCTVAQVHAAVSDAIHCRPSDSREAHAEGPLKVVDSASSCPSRNGAVSHPPFGLSNGVQPPVGSSCKGFRLRPPHPAPSNQFSYVQADQRRDIAIPYSNVLHMQNADNRSFPRGRNGMKSVRREIGESWMEPSHYSGPCFPDGSRGHYTAGSYPAPHEPPMSSHKWGYPPRVMNRREIFIHRPPPEHPIPVTSRDPGFWRPR